MKYKGS